MKATSIILVLILLSTDTLFGQENDRRIDHSITLKNRFIQLKDEFNYGLVFNGLNFEGEYSFVSEADENVVIYNAGFGFGASYNHGVGLNWSFKPVDLFYGFKLNRNSDIAVTLGPYLSGYYKWNLYPELQSGHMFWISSWEVGPRLRISFPYNSKTIIFYASNSIISLNSRPEFKTEEYFYSLTLKDIVKNPHSNMTFGLQNVFNHIDVILELKDKNKRMSVGYEFEYISYVTAPSFKFVTHSLNLKWLIGKIK